MLSCQNITLYVRYLPLAKSGIKGATPLPTTVATPSLTDYKFMCFDGKVRCTFTVTERFSPGGLKVTFFDSDWNVMPFERHYPRSATPIPRPQAYDEMVTLAERLSEGIPFVRADFYEVAGHVYFGEMTFFPGSGHEEFTPEEWDATLGAMISLPV